jgi:hypothetical protein
LAPNAWAGMMDGMEITAVAAAVFLRKLLLD